MIFFSVVICTAAACTSCLHTYDIITFWQITPHLLVEVGLAAGHRYRSPSTVLRK